MKISRDWLSDFIDWIETDPEVIADQMTRCMGEVDEVTHQGRYMDRVVVGRVQTLGKHPNADKLSVCRVQTDEGPKHVVCGGTNLREGMLVAFAHVGATVLAEGKEEVTLRKVFIRGVESEGMICAAEEVEIDYLFPSKPEDGHRPIADLSILETKNQKLKTKNSTVGTPLRKALGLTDVVFHIDNHAITNRADLFSHVGVARELVALGLAKWKPAALRGAYAAYAPRTGFKFPSAKPIFELKNDAGALVPHYFAAVVNIPNMPPTPDWMKRKLEAVGWRSINLAVDITNYVLMEVGMPLHGFDIDDFKGALHIRKARKGEAITTLDQATRELPEGAVIISDDAGIFDLFAVMGGLRTSTKDTTKRILVQAGIIDPTSVRRTIMTMSHRTDAATVYEKGIAPITAERGLYRAIELFLALCPGATVSSTLIHWGTEKPKKSITLGTTTLDTFLGEPIKPARATKILSDLGFKVKVTGKTLTATPPPWRGDIAIKQDIVEEIARIYGYATIKPTMPEASIVPPARETRIHAMSDSLKESKYFELVNLAFAGPELLRKCGLDPGDAVAIENPIGEEASLMRTSLVPSILDTLSRELPRSVPPHLKVFEYGHRFLKGKELQVFACAVAAKQTTTLKDDPVLILKADLLAALRASGHTAIFAKATNAEIPFAHPGRFGNIECNGKTIGFLTEVHPDVRSNFGLPFRAAVAALGLDTLLSLVPETKIAALIPMFPPVEFDETLPLTEKAYDERIARIRTLDPILESVEIINLYEKGADRNMTLHFTYRAKDRTLKQEEVEKVHQRVVATLAKG